MKKQLDDAALERRSQEHGRRLGVIARGLRTEKGLTQLEVAKRESFCSVGAEARG